MGNKGKHWDVWQNRKGTCNMYISTLQWLTKFLFHFHRSLFDYCSCPVYGRPMTAPPPPSPHHLLRTHAVAVNVIYFSDDNERLYSADSSGRVSVTSTRSLRPLASWKAHTDALLGVEEFESFIITYVLDLPSIFCRGWGTICNRHGRDNKLHIWSTIHETRSTLGSSATSPDLQTPEFKYSMDVNALNYCRFSLMPVSTGTSDSALISLPNLVESSLVCPAFVIHEWCILVTSFVIGRHMDHTVPAKTARSHWEI